MRAYVIFRDYVNNARGMELLRSVADEVVMRETDDRPGEAELLQLVRDYDILVIGVIEKMSDTVFEAAIAGGRLKYLCTTSIAVDHISRKFFDSNIKVINVSEANVVSVAEFALAYIMSDIKRFDEGHAAFAAGTGRKGMSRLPGEMSSRTIGVVGAGKIATKLFKMAAPFGPRMLCWTFNPDKHADLAEIGVEFVALDRLVAESDYIAPLIPFSDRTDGLLSRDILGDAKPGAKIVHASHMGVVDMAAFRDSVLAGRFGGSLLDCLNSKIDPDIARGILPFVRFTPHVAGVSEEAQVRIFVEVMGKLAALVSSQTKG